MNEATGTVVSLACVLLALVCQLRALLITLHVDRKMRAHGFWLFAVGFGLRLVADGVMHDSLWMYIDTALVTVSLYFWWKGGGGDDTKRRLSKLFPRLVPHAV